MRREEFLARVAERLGRTRSAPPTARAPSQVDATPGRLSAPDPCSGFAAELEKVGGACVRIAASALAERIEALRLELGPRGIVTWGREEFRGLALEAWFERVGARAPLTDFGTGAPADELDAGYLAACAAADWGLTTAHAAVAATGTLVLTCAPGRPRATSLLPAAHLAIVRASQLVPRLSDLDEFRGASAGLPSQLLCVTGPSRTSDIENDLTIGVHGPAAVVVFLLEDR